jgi:predicted N-formylglutamate amidohydrolase
LLISLHSFTPQLATRLEEARPWEIGVLYNNDDRAARVAIPALVAAGARVGDNLPYSGKILNATMNRHGECNGIPYLGLEVRQDLIGEPRGVARWGDVLVGVIMACLAPLDAT